MTVKLQRVEPLRIEKAIAFSLHHHGEGGCTFGEVDHPIFPDPPFDLHAIRVDLGLSLGDVSRRLGISVSEASGLERGRYTPVDGWDVIVARLRETT